MSVGSIRLPPLNSLKVFWVVMQHGSFRDAANELLISPQAVSQQIRLLEDILGVSLFERKARIIVPTEQAVTLFPFVKAGFNELSEGIKRISRSNYRSSININVSPFFATHYLMERLNIFCEQLPDANLRLTTMTKFPDFAADEIDISIQWGFGKWEGYDSALLVRDPKIICCAPEIAEKIKSEKDLSHLPLLHPVHARSLWSTVLSYLGIGEHEVSKKIQFQDADTMRRAAISGLGVGLISQIDALDDIQKGLLTAPLGVQALADMPEDEVPGFYVVLPRSHRRVSIINRFWLWITSEKWNRESMKISCPD